MKNIHVLPTDKPAKVYVRADVKPHFYNNFQGKGLNIYITNNEKIKEGDWFLTKTNDILKVQKPEKSYDPMGKKIILTTDQDLIKDGVQAIDDEFLEWFVKNPTCEFVEVEEKLKYFNIDELRERHLKGLTYIYSEKIGYKIIIPKEEHKPIHEKIIDSCGGEKALKKIAGIKSKQETLEEVATKEGLYRCSQHNFNQAESGYNAKWFKRGAVFGADWQEQRMYSEEEVSQLLYDLSGQVINNKVSNPKELELWFNQFKKK